MYLINETFVTEQKRKLQILVRFDSNWYTVQVIINNSILAEMRVPDTNYMDKPIPNNEMEDRIKQLVPHMHKIIEIFEKP